MSIESWYIPTIGSSVQYSRIRMHGHFEVKVYLEKISTNGEPPTVSSRLLGRVNEGLYNGDEIRCSDATTTVVVSQSLNLHYSLVMGKCFNSSIGINLALQE